MRNGLLRRARTQLVAAVGLTTTVLVTGAALAPVAGAATLRVPVARIDFGPDGVAPPAGYTADTGAAYDATRGWGWVATTGSTPQSMAGNGRDRNLVTDQRLDSIIHLQAPAGTTPGTSTPGRWELKVTNGLYNVKVAVGDPASYGDSAHTILVEGKPLITRWVGTSSSRTKSAEMQVQVTDGRITLNPNGGTNTKLAYVDVDRLDAPAPAPPVRTGPAWPSTSASQALGIFIAGGRDGIEPHETWLGREVGYRLHFASWDTWTNAAKTFDTITDPTKGYVAGNDRTLVLGMGLTMKEGSSGGTQARAKLQAAADGANDAFWTTVGQTIHARGLDVPYPDGRPKLVLRVGWEHNGTWYPWSSQGNEAVHAKAWRRAHDRVEANAPGAVWSWGLTTEQSNPDAIRASWPGDDYVDVVEIDVYDNYAGYPGVGGDADPIRRVKAWDYKVHSKVGLDFAAQLAAEKGKAVAIGESGLVRQVTSKGQVGGGDNASFIRNVHAWVASQAAAGRLGWATYFETDNGDMLHALRVAGAAPGSTAGSQYPEAAAAFLDLYGA